MNYAAKHSMLAIEVRSRIVAEEERATVGIRAGVRHRQDTGMRMSDPDLFIGELGAVCALSFNTFIVSNDFAALHHKARNDSLEYAIAEVQVEAKFTSAERAEVLDCAGHFLLEKFHHDTAVMVALLSLCSDLDIHVNLDVTHGKVRHLVVYTGLIITVLTVHEDLGCCVSNSFVITIGGLLDFTLARLPMLFQNLVTRLKLYSLATVGECVGKVLKLKVRHAT